MIVKKAEKKDIKKSKFTTIRDLYNYINGISTLEGNEKVLFKGNLNLNSKNDDEIIAEMADLAMKSTRSKNPFEHFILSLHEDEQFTEEAALDAVKIFLENLEYDCCQVAYAVHGNTDNEHIHIIVNRVNPTTFKCQKDSKDFEKSAKAIAVISQKYGYQIEEHERYIMIDNELTKVIYPDSTTTIKIPSKARDSEVFSGEKSITRIAAENIIPILQTSKSWKELHLRLALQGFRYEKKGGGATLRYTKTDGKKYEIKPSSLDKEFSLKYMEKRLGKYIIPTTEVVKQEPVPMDGISKEILNQYNSDKKDDQEKSNTSNNEKTDDYEEFKRNIEKLNSEYREIIAYINKHNWEDHEIELNSLRKSCKIIKKERIDDLILSYRKKLHAKKAKGLKVEISNNKETTNCFEAWLKIKYPEKCDEIISNLRKASNLINMSSVLQNDDLTKAELFKVYHTAIKADRYRVTLSKKYEDGKKHTIILDKPNHNAKSYGFTPEELITAIPTMTKYERKGYHVYYTPLSEKMNHILIDDVTADKIQRLKKIGIQPNCILESSPNNYQCIVNTPKVANDLDLIDKEIRNKLAAALNREFGDVNLCCATHAHRAPGFYNVKDKYKREDGTFPIVQVIETYEQICTLLTDYIHFMEGYLKYEMEKQNKVKEKLDETIKTNIEVNTIQEKKILYKAHFDDILKNKKWEAEDLSRIDYMIAMRLRVTGHTKEEIAEIVKAGSPERSKAASYFYQTADVVFNTFAEQTYRKSKKYEKRMRLLEETVSKRFLIEQQKKKKQKLDDVKLQVKEMQKAEEKFNEDLKPKKEKENLTISTYQNMGM